MIEIGKNYTLKVNRFKQQGAYLMEDNSEEEVLLPNKYCLDNIEEGQEINVFVYKDSEQRLVATTLKPNLYLQEFGYLKVKQITKVGAFLDWGLEKDLFVPFSEQAIPMELDRSYVVFLYLDEATNRLVASSRINDFCDNEEINLEEGEEVDILPFSRTDLGYNVVVNDIHRGLIFENEVFQTLKIGSRTKGFVKQVRPDNKIDVSLRKQGYEVVEDFARDILDKLQNAENNFLPFNDKSSPESIKNTFQMSKKVFKKSIGSLYKMKMILIEKDGIKLV